MNNSQSLPSSSPQQRQLWRSSVTALSYAPLLLWVVHRSVAILNVDLTTFLMRVVPIRISFQKTSMTFQKSLWLFFTKMQSVSFLTLILQIIWNVCYTCSLNRFFSSSTLILQKDILWRSCDKGETLQWIIRKCVLLRKIPWCRSSDYSSMDWKTMYFSIQPFLTQHLSLSCYCISHQLLKP